MAKTPNKSSLATRKGAASRSRKTPVTFADENTDSEEMRNEEKADEQSEDEDMNVNKLLQEIQKRQAKKTSLVSAAFENQKKALYANARQKAKDMSQDGTVYLEKLKHSILSMRESEVSYDRHLQEFRGLWDAQDAAATKLFGLYPPIIDDLFVRRAETIDEASKMLKLNPAKRQKALNQFLCNAHDQVEQSHQNKMVATDASKLIKHYKALLLS
ncbi:hypothetical protein D9758_000827 [Tetrapyrgos nigripes]|uniref:Uncharacterized protein n=1 Tax=Tetrapyrgos nigripes TaxID=182062 RepID=A0A8H5LY56_9AGAR|nr:hypothetical protein D9758_000827 [Tetrapyrgos nigripes]